EGIARRGIGSRITADVRRAIAVDIDVQNPSGPTATLPEEHVPEAGSDNHLPLQSHGRGRIRKAFCGRGASYEEADGQDHQGGGTPPRAPCGPARSEMLVGHKGLTNITHR